MGNNADLHKGVIFVSKDQKVSAAEDVEVNIILRDAYNDRYIDSGLSAWYGGTIELGKVIINAGSGDQKPGAAANEPRSTWGIFAGGDNSFVSIGDGSEVYSRNNGTAILSTEAAKVIVGDNAKLYGNVYG